MKVCTKNINNIIMLVALELSLTQMHNQEHAKKLEKNKKELRAEMRKHAKECKDCSHALKRFLQAVRETREKYKNHNKK